MELKVDKVIIIVLWRMGIYCLYNYFCECVILLRYDYLNRIFFRILFFYSDKIFGDIIDEFMFIYI